MIRLKLTIKAFTQLFNEGWWSVQVLRMFSFAIRDSLEQRLRKKTMKRMTE
jgi:hypothetical protein